MRRSQTMSALAKPTSEGWNAALEVTRDGLHDCCASGEGGGEEGGVSWPDSGYPVSA